MSQLDHRLPSPRQGFEADFVSEMKRLFSELPAGSGELYIGRVPNHEEWPEPFVEVTPTNTRAARFGAVAVSEDVTITIGAAEREFVGFAQGSSLIDGASWQRELEWIWRAVVAGHFTQRQYFDDHGNIIGWSSRIVADEHEMIMRNGRTKEHLLGTVNMREVTYEAYVTARPT